MTEWRDARLHKALESAPDGQARPDPVTRAKVRDFAHRAVAPAAAVPWWRELWRASGDNRMPWNAAFATLALATLVTLLWRDEEIPGAKPDSAADRSASARVPTPSAAPAAKPAVPAADLAQPKARTEAQDATVAGERRSKAQAPQDSAREGKAQSSADALNDRPANALQKSAPPVVEEARPPPLGRSEAVEVRGTGMPAAPAGPAATGSARDDGQQAAPSLRAPAAAPAEAPPAAVIAPAPAPLRAPAFRAAPAPAAVAPPSPAAVAVPPAQWNQLRILTQGRTVDVTREQGQRLADQLETIARTASAAEPLAEPVSLRVELRLDGDATVIFEQAGAQVRVNRLRAGAASQLTARPDPAQLRALQAEVERLSAGR